MGVNCAILLPADVRVRDAADVIGILAGLKPEWYDPIPSVRVPGVKISPSNMAECAQIEIVSREGKTLVDGEFNHWALFHWEVSGTNGMRLLSRPSNPFWIAVGKRLVDFFGGTVDYNDCDDKMVDYRAKKPRRRNDPEGGKAWDNFQKALYNIAPLTQKDLKKVRKYAAYK